MRRDFAVYLMMALLGFAPTALAIHPGVWSKAGEEARWETARPDSHAPIGVMADHWHKKDGMMLAYRYGNTEMNGNRVGTQRVSTQEVLADFPVAPTAMRMQHHMFGLMYAPFQRVTLMAAVPYKKLSMDHSTIFGSTFRTQADGIGDVSLTALFVAREDKRSRLHFNLGLSMPTGSIHQSGLTPMGVTRLPYPMQLGSGTFDLLPGITYMWQHDSFSLGGQALAVLRLGRNDSAYTLGDTYQASLWVSKPVFSEWSFSVRLSGVDWGNIDGADPELNPAVTPTAVPSLRAGRRVDVYAGLNYFGRRGLLKGHRLALEFRLPVYQNLDGPQLETDWGLMFGWQYAFKLK